jgi:hypothetical protein
MLRQNIKNTFQLIAASAVGLSLLSPAMASEADSVTSTAAFNRVAPTDPNGAKPRQAEFYSESLGLYFGASDAYSNSSESEKSEFDTYAGIAKKYGELGYNVGVKAYNQNLDSERNLNEFFVGGSYKLFNLGYATSDLGEYAQIGVNHKMKSMDLQVHMGTTMPEKGESYYDWRINAVKQYKGLTLNASLINREVPTELREEGPELSVGLSRKISLF